MEHKIGIFYGSSTGTTQSLAEQIALKTGVSKADTHDVADAAPDTIDGYDCLLLGSSTWGDGDLQDDWYGFLDKIKTRDLSGKTVALFGCGDSESYPDTFCNALGTIYEELQPTGCPVRRRIRAAGLRGDRLGRMPRRKVRGTGRRRTQRGRQDRRADRPLDRNGEKGTVMSEQEYARFGDMKMFMHHIYEFKKGVRSLVLCTMCRTCASIVAERLRGAANRLHDSGGLRKEGQPVLRQTGMPRRRQDIHTQASEPGCRPRRTSCWARCSATTYRCSAGGTAIGKACGKSPHSFSHLHAICFKFHGVRIIPRGAIRTRSIWSDPEPDYPKIGIRTARNTDLHGLPVAAESANFEVAFGMRSAVRRYASDGRHRETTDPTEASRAK